MGIAGKNREGMCKYRRFVGNPEESKNRGGHLGVRNALWRVNFRPPMADLARPFRRHGVQPVNAAVTDPSCNVP
jgi:hypothetical protein